MMKFFKFFEYAYLVIAVFFAYQTIQTWNESRERAYLFIFLMVMAVCMYFFKRRFRKKIEKRNNQR